MKSSVSLFRLLAVVATLGTLVAVLPTTLLHADDEAATCGISAEDEAATAENSPAPVDLEVAFVTAQAGSVAGGDIKSTCNARDIQFFQNRLERGVIMIWKVTNLGDCELVITGPWGDIRVQRFGLIDASSSQAWIAQLSGGDSVKYSCRGADASKTCAFLYQMEVVQVLSN